MCLILSRVMEHQVCTYSSYELSLLLYRPMEPGVGYSTVTGKRHLPLKLDVLRRKGCTSQEEMIDPSERSLTSRSDTLRKWFDCCIRSILLGPLAVGRLLYPKMVRILTVYG